MAMKRMQTPDFRVITKNGRRIIPIPNTLTTLSLTFLGISIGIAGLLGFVFGPLLLM